MTQVRALIIEPTGRHRIEDLGGFPEWSGLRAAIGGPGFITVQLIHPQRGWDVGGRWLGCCDEEGKLKHLPVNRPATVLAHAGGWPIGDFLVGTVVFIGAERKDDSEEGDVPEELLGLWSHVLAIASVVASPPDGSGDTAIRPPSGAAGSFSESAEFRRGGQA